MILSKRMRFAGLISLLFLSVGNVITAQDKSPFVKTGGYVFVDLGGDTIRYRDQAAIALRKLKTGAVIFRIKTSEKSLAAYRAAGQNQLADKIAEERKAQNERLYDAFKTEFTFSKVYFIFAKDTRRFLDGTKGLFLNAALEYDPSIHFSDSNFVFCEYGSAEAFSQFTDQSSYAVDRPSIAGGKYTGAEPHEILDTASRRTSTQPATTSGIFFSDKNGKQFQRPFPYTEAVYLNNPFPTVRMLNREMERIYTRVVSFADFKLKMKQERKEAKKKKKEQPKDKTRWIDY